ncbi:nucleotidyltransferase family protein [Thermococcus sp. 21S9]|uniref:nucleotidyltransferase family protein n=1 Tax=Thermococcus sp. 21S9 TaxID=1638223 RepID=UPI001438CF8C|nr:nucleotidyltransferase domain-containing protein [Thermococcus sp. 21S9]NJE54991.1 nucleotidyltransferase domain-containing protein [Thermococcus sp. 21S9]
MPVIPREELLEILREVKEKLIEILGDDLVDVILFGSYARGEAKEDSDVDVIVMVKRRLTLEEHDRLSEITEKYVLEKGLVVSLIVYPVNPRMEHDPLIQNVYTEGVKV